MNDKSSAPPRVLVVDDEKGAREALSTLLADDGYDVRDAPDGMKALGLIEEWAPDVMLTDIRMPLMDGMDLMRRAREVAPTMPCVVMTAFGSIDTAVEAMKIGAHDYLTKPLNFDVVQLTLERVLSNLQLRREVERLRAERDRPTERRGMVGRSAELERVIRLADQVAASRATVLVTGESGTGKEMIAQRIHEQSPRSVRPFHPLHCAALSETLLESELFGHEKGSFTGAAGRRAGRFETAAGGTLFLDEIGEIGPSTQVKLLRFLQTKEFVRVGGNEPIRVDVRIVAATNRDLLAMVREGTFREDLYYRLNVIEIPMPALRERRSDIPLLVRHFMAQYAAENDKSLNEIDPAAMRALERYDWPGNVRELENVVERAVVLADGPRLLAEHLPQRVRDDDGLQLEAAGLRIPGSSLADLERHAILRTYEATGGDTAEVARVLGISQRKVQYRLRDYREQGVA